MEQIDLYDKNRQPLHQTIERGKVLPADTYRAVVHICIFNTKGEMLIQQRQSTKALLPDKWDISAGGQVSAGETSSAAADREVIEELGLHLDIASQRPKLTMNFEDGFDDVYLLTKDISPDELVLQPEEVQNARFAGLDTVLQMIAEGSFVPYHETYIRLLFAMQNLDGTFDEEKVWSEKLPDSQ